MSSIFFKKTFSVVALLCAAQSAIAEERELRATSAFGLGTTFSRDFESFVDWVNKHGKGEIQINLLGGPEAIPPFEQGNAVQSGVVDMINDTSAFYANLVPSGDALHLAENTIQDQRANGCYEQIDNIHQTQMNAKYLARIGDNMPFHLYTTELVKGLDLSGLTIRTTPVYRAMFSALGANLVRTAPGEVYSALERGSIDGYGWLSQGVLDLGWHEQTKYRVDPGFYQVDVNVLVNLDVWNSLTDSQRAKLEEGATWIEARNIDNIGYNANEYAAQAKAGIKTISLTGEQREKWLDAAQNEGWAVVEGVDPDLAGKLRRCLSN